MSPIMVCVHQYLILIVMCLTLVFVLYHHLNAQRKKNEPNPNKRIASLSSTWMLWIVLWYDLFMKWAIFNLRSSANHWINTQNLICIHEFSFFFIFLMRKKLKMAVSHLCCDCIYMLLGCMNVLLTCSVFFFICVCH